MPKGRDIDVAGESTIPKSILSPAGEGEGIIICARASTFSEPFGEALAFARTFLGPGIQGGRRRSGRTGATLRLPVRTPLGALIVLNKNGANFL